MTQWYQMISLWSVAILFAGAATLQASERETPEVCAVRRALPSVGNIHTEKSANLNSQNNIFATDKGRKINGMGTGIVVDERGYMVTNYHVIADVDTIRVDFHDKSSYLARRINVDRENDLALIKIDPLHPLKVMPHGTSSDLMLCEKCIAIGNAFGYQSTVTVGYISSLSRDVEANETQFYRNLIQTDAAINPGNSGGPLVNLLGEVIGINVAIRQGAQKIGFAIPIDDARRSIAKLMNIEQIDRTYHGLIAKDVKVGATRMLVVDGAQPDSPASLAGLKTGDVIVKAGNVEVVDGVDWERAFLGHPVGDKIEVSLKRNEKLETATISLAAYTGGRISVNPEVAVTPRASGTADDDRFWQQLGLKMSVLPTNQKNLVAPKYRGGMRVSDVRTDGPAAANGIQKGDILVGLDKWETLSTDNVNWILSQQQPQLTDGQISMKFYVIRGQETRYGYLAVTLAPRIASSQN
ncbi:MAG: trypsin-like peptidase domain-containing protein [Planctomycetes bacterium]|nr:trypsin-like peptidase domain-containing protein [Planctomycetota bacterium]